VRSASPFFFQITDVSPRPFFLFLPVREKLSPPLFSLEARILQPEAEPFSFSAIRGFPLLVASGSPPLFKNPPIDLLPPPKGGGGENFLGIRMDEFHPPSFDGFPLINFFLR